MIGGPPPKAIWPLGVILRPAMVAWCGAAALVSRCRGGVDAARARGLRSAACERWSRCGGACQRRARAESNAQSFSRGARRTRTLAASSKKSRRDHSELAAVRH